MNTAALSVTAYQEVAKRLQGCAAVVNNNKHMRVGDFAECRFVDGTTLDVPLHGASSLTAGDLRTTLQDWPNFDVALNNEAAAGPPRLSVRVPLADEARRLRRQQFSAWRILKETLRLLVLLYLLLLVVKAMWLYWQHGTLPSWPELWPRAALHNVEYIRGLINRWR
jgi:hypothetical protein